jgi:hypothetical protein
MFVVVALESVELPPLAFITPQVVHIERAVGLAGPVQIALYLDQPLARGVDGVATQVYANPASAQLFSDRQGGAAAAEAVEYEIAFI